MYPNVSCCILGHTAGRIHTYFCILMYPDVYSNEAEDEAEDEAEEEAEQPPPPPAKGPSKAKKGKSRKAPEAEAPQGSSKPKRAKK